MGNLCGCQLCSRSQCGHSPHIHGNLCKMYQTVYPCTCINISQIHLKEKLKQNSFAYYKGLMSKLRLYSLMSYYIELFTLLGALRAKFRPVYKCLYNKSPGESKFIRTVLFHKDQWTRDSAECCWDQTACICFFSVIILMILLAVMNGRDVIIPGNPIFFLSGFLSGDASCHSRPRELS